MVEAAGAAEPEAAWEPASQGGDAVRRLTGPVPPLPLYNEGELGVLRLVLPASDSRAATLFKMGPVAVCKGDHDVGIAAATWATWSNAPAALCSMVLWRRCCCDLTVTLMTRHPVLCGTCFQPADTLRVAQTCSRQAAAFAQVPTHLLMHRPGPG